MLISKNESELIQIAQRFAKKIKKGNVIILKGDLGSGKTTFVKGIAKELRIDEVITSPTYSIIKEYDNLLCHIDAYRINKEEIGLEYYIDKKYIICIEWSDNIEDEYDYDYKIEINYSNEGRTINIMEKNE